MSVKLLPKSELASLKAKAQGREIQEGAKIATRVDGLRSLWAKTETDFELYKTSTLTAIQAEITKATEEKEQLTTLVNKLKAEYELLLPEIPLKRQELSKFEKRLMSWEKKLEKREEKAGLLEINVQEALQKAEFAKGRHEDNERISRNLLIQANKKSQEANDTLMTAKSIIATAEKEKKEMENVLTLREMSIKSQEQELLTNQMNLASDRHLLAIEKAKVADMRATVQRSIERLRQGRLA